MFSMRFVHISRDEKLLKTRARHIHYILYTYVYSMYLRDNTGTRETNTATVGSMYENPVDDCGTSNPVVVEKSEDIQQRESVQRI